MSASDARGRTRGVAKREERGAVERERHRDGSRVASLERIGMKTRGARLIAFGIALLGPSSQPSFGHVPSSRVRDVAADIRT